MFKRFKHVIFLGFLVLAVGAGLLIPEVKVNYDSLAYLPEDSRTKEAFQVMANEFGNKGSLMILVEGLDTESKINNVRGLLAIEPVEGIDYRTRDDMVLFSLVLSDGDYTKEAGLAIRRLIGILDDNGYIYHMDGQAYLTYVYNKTINEQITYIILLLVPIVLIILLLMNRSYFEPVLFLATIGFSVLLNMGTNAFLPDVSYMTHSIAAVVQFAVCMDYSIMLLHRYQDCRKEEQDAQTAMKKAWRSSLVPILSSSLTTVAGFVAIMFMKYRIGLDIGMVLAKGVLWALLTNLFLLPCLILVFDRVLEKSSHEPFFSILRRKSGKNDGLEGSRLGRFVFRTRYFVPLALLLIIACSFVLQRNNDFLYSDNTTANDMKAISEGRKKIKENFGMNATAVILVDADLDASDLIASLLNLKMDGVSPITGVMAYDLQLTVSEFRLLVKDYGLSDENIAMLYGMINKNMVSKDTISLRELSLFIPVLKQFGVKMGPDELSAFVGRLYPISSDDISMIYTLTGESQLSVRDILIFLNGQYDVDELKTMFSGLISEEEIDQMDLSLNQDDYTVSEVLQYFYDMLFTATDANRMSLILGNSVSAEELASLYQLLGQTEVSMNDLAVFFTSCHSQEEMAMIFNGLDSSMVSNVYQLMAQNNLLDEGKATIRAFAEFLKTNFAAYLTEENLMMLNSFLQKVSVFENILPLMSMTEKAVSVTTPLSSVDLSALGKLEGIDSSAIDSRFVGNRYQRIILSLNMAEENQSSFDYVTMFEEQIKEKVTGPFHIISRTSAVMEIKDMSDRDYVITTIISILAVFIIIMLSFRSLAVPIILIILIEGAVFINMAIPALSSEPLIFMGYIIVSCLQLGATIDYAILITHRYRENRIIYDRKHSMFLTIDESFGSIVTSGLILAVAGFILALVSPIPVIASMGRLIGLAGAISMTLVLIALPQVLYLLDGLVIRHFKGGDGNISNPA